MGISVREDYDVTRSQLLPPSFGKPGVGTPFGQEVIDDQVPRFRGKIVGYIDGSR
jgi:hypothetical protein